MNADAGNLPDMLRQPDGVVFVKDVNMSGVTGPEIGHELAALVEADDKLAERVREVLADDLRIGGDPWYEPALQDEHKGHDYDLTGLLRARDAARAALVAALGGDK